MTFPAVARLIFTARDSLKTPAIACRAHDGTGTPFYIFVPARLLFSTFYYYICKQKGDF